MNLLLTFEIGGKKYYFFHWLPSTKIPQKFIEFKKDEINYLFFVGSSKFDIAPYSEEELNKDVLFGEKTFKYDSLKNPFIFNIGIPLSENYFPNYMKFFIKLLLIQKLTFPRFLWKAHIIV